MSDDPILRGEFDRVLNGVLRAEERMTARIDEGFAHIDGRVRPLENKSQVFESRLSLIERVIFAGVGLALAGVVLAVLNMVVRP